MNEVQVKLIYLTDVEGIKKKFIAKKLGVTPEYISYLIKGTRNASQKLKDQIDEL
jgi:plasmid maintenance system antidote protein VapI